MRALLETVGGFGVFLLLVARHRSLYRGARAFYRLAQRQPATRSSRLAAAALSGPFAALCVDYRFAEEQRSCTRLSSRAVVQYGQDDALQGYGDATWTKGGATLATQQRGQILPLLEARLAALPPSHVLEIGTGNGDVIADLAGRFPQHQFTGVDFSVATARRIHADARATFVAGYALDLFADGLTADLVCASATCVVFTPEELRAYCRQFRARGVREIIVCEPSWGGYVLEADSPAVSDHLEGACWAHQYAGYLREAGYAIRSCASVPYVHPISRRPDIRLGLVHATRDTRAVAAIASDPTSLRSA